MTTLRRTTEKRYFMPLKMTLAEAEALPPFQSDDDWYSDVCERCGKPDALLVAIKDDAGWVMLDLPGEDELHVWCIWLCNDEKCRSWKAVVFLTDLYRLEVKQS